MIKASELINYINKHFCHASVIDTSDVEPHLIDIYIERDWNDYKCYLSGFLVCNEEDLKNSINHGLCQIEILGVIFQRAFLSIYDEVKIIGEIDYDQNLTKKDILNAFDGNIFWSTTDTINYFVHTFNEDNITENEILALLSNIDKYTFAVNYENNEIYGFDDIEDIPDDTYKIISDEEAFEKFAKERQGFSCKSL